MKTTKYRLGIFTVWAAFILFFAGVGRADDASWIRGTSGPGGWRIKPRMPSVSDLISFSGPTSVFPNTCVAEGRMGGKPALTIDPNNKTIKLYFLAPPSTDCPRLADYVCGIEGSFGLLDKGDWQFSGDGPGAYFSISFTVSEGPGGDAGAGEPNVCVLYVDANAAGDNDGSSWANAFVHLQDALAAATGDCEIRVAQGVYRPDLGLEAKSGDPNSVFQLEDGIVIKGGYAGVRGPDPNARDIVLYETVLSGDLNGDDANNLDLRDLLDHPSRADNSYHVVALNAPEAVAVLDGLTISGGNANGLRIPNEYVCGGGIYDRDGALMLRHCLVTQNSAWLFGGGMFNGSRNRKSLVDCTFRSNWSYWWGGAIFNDWYSAIEMVRCKISQNTARVYGGAFFSGGDCSLELSNCLLSGNSALDAAWGRGGAMYSYASTARLAHCTLVGNWAPAGSCLSCYSVDEPQISHVQFENCILWNQGEEMWINDKSAIEIVHSDIEGGWPGEGNIDVDPRFVTIGHWEDAGTPQDPCDDHYVDGDYHLSPDSPCIDAGDPNYLSDPTITDLEGNRRISGPATDMGAYELWKNDPPVADAGPDQTVLVRVGDVGQVTLDGSGSHDPEGEPLTYTWFADGNQVAEGVKPTIDVSVGERTFELVVNDGELDSAPDQVKVTVELRNDPPVADAGPDQTVLVRVGDVGQVTLDGSGSHDPEGEPLTYTWFADGNQVAEGVKPTIEVLVGEHTFELVVKDGELDSAPDQVKVTVELRNDPPVADAGPDQTVFIQSGDVGQVTLDGSGSHDPEGQPLTYTWFADGNQVAEGVKPTIDVSVGEHTFELVVNDGAQDSAPDQVKVTVELRNDPPVADAGPDQMVFIQIGDVGQVTLDGSGSHDPEGQPLTYTWFADGNQVAEGVKPTVDVSVGEHTFELVVNDGALDSVPDQVKVTVELRNDPPVADAGPDQMAFVRTGGTGQVTLDGSGSHDPEGQPLTYTWFEEGKQVAEGVKPTIDVSVGDHTFELVVNDGAQDSAPDQFKVKVVKHIEANLSITPKRISRGGRAKIRAVLRLRDTITMRDVDASQRLVMYPGGISASTQWVFRWSRPNTLVIGLFDRASLLKAVPENGELNLEVVGRLKDGKYFGGTASVKIDK